MTNYEKHIVAMPSILEGYTVPKFESSEITLELIEDGTFSLTRCEFANAFNLIFSHEFAELCNAINKSEGYRELAYRRSDKALDMLSENALDTMGLFDSTNAFKRYGYYEGVAHEKRESIIENAGWLTWIDACKLYEHFTGTPREWLS